MTTLTLQDAIALAPHDEETNNHTYHIALSIYWLMRLPIHTLKQLFKASVPKVDITTIQAWLRTQHDEGRTCIVVGTCDDQDIKGYCKGHPFTNHKKKH